MRGKTFKQRTVDLEEEVAGAVGFYADDDAVGVEEIAHGGAFTKEFRVNGNVEVRSEELNVRS